MRKSLLIDGRFSHSRRRRCRLIMGLMRGLFLHARLLVKNSPTWMDDNFPLPTGWGQIMNKAISTMRKSLLMDEFFFIHSRRCRCRFIMGLRRLFLHGRLLVKNWPTLMDDNFPITTGWGKIMNWKTRYLQGWERASSWMDFFRIHKDADLGS